MPRAKAFSIRISPQVHAVDVGVDWKSLSSTEIEQILARSIFPTADKLDEIFRTVEIRTRKRYTNNKYFSELGSKSGIPHYQGLIVIDVGTTVQDVVHALSNPIYQQSRCAQLDVSPAYDLESLHGYISKDPWIVNHSAYAVGERSTIKDWNHINRALQPKLMEVIDCPRMWQDFATEIIESDPDDRAIYWFCDPKGKTGKTAYSKSVSFLRSELKCCYLQPDRHDRFKSFIVKTIREYRRKNGCYLRCYIINLPRAIPASEIGSLCKTIEEIKDGVLQTNFGGDFSNELIPYSHVVVMTNMGPDLERQSLDRWQIFWIADENFSYMVQPVEVYPFVHSYDPDLKTVSWTTTLKPLGYREENKTWGKYNAKLYPDLVDKMRETVIEKRLVVKAGKTIKTSKEYYQNTYMEDRCFKCFCIECSKFLTKYENSPEFVQRIVHEQKAVLISRYANQSGDHREHLRILQARLKLSKEN